MKLPTPYSVTEFNRLKQIKKIEVDKLRNIPEQNHDIKKIQTGVVLEIVDKMFKYINVVDYNKYAKNRCKFRLDGCEGRFRNTIGNYSTSGNCCKSCNSIILNNIKQNYVQD